MKTPEQVQSASDSAQRIVDANRSKGVTAPATMLEVAAYHRGRLDAFEWMLEDEPVRAECGGIAEP